jgi:3-hydroxyacyl-[acyl-carrier-protein] dehydratase
MIPSAPVPVPHGHPFVFVDRVVETEPGRRAVGIKNVTANEAMLRGHFPGEPILPGVLVIEAMAQVAGIALHSADPPGQPGRSYLAAVRNVKFRRPVTPGDQLRLTAVLTGRADKLAQFDVKAEVNGEIVADGEIVLG